MFFFEKNYKKKTLIIINIPSAFPVVGYLWNHLHTQPIRVEYKKILKVVFEC